VGFEGSEEGVFLFQGRQFDDGGDHVLDGVLVIV
jgi:hypothetical protein